MADGSDRPSVAIVAHGIHDAGGMERVLAELIRRIHREWRVVVIASEVADDLRPLVDWRRVRVPRRPFPLKFLHVLRPRKPSTGMDPDRPRAHLTGAIVANRADVATVHFCHAGFREATGALAPKSAPSDPEGEYDSGAGARAGGRALVLSSWATAPPWPPSRAVWRAELARHYPAVPVRLTPNGVDVERFAPDAGDARSAPPGGMVVAPGVLVALFVGGDWDRKGLAPCDRRESRRPGTAGPRWSSGWSGVARNPGSDACQAGRRGREGALLRRTGRCGTVLPGRGRLRPPDRL